MAVTADNDIARYALYLNLYCAEPGCAGCSGYVWSDIYDEGPHLVANCPCGSIHDLVRVADLRVSKDAWDLMNEAVAAATEKQFPTEADELRPDKAIEAATRRCERGFNGPAENVQELVNHIQRLESERT